MNQTNAANAPNRLRYLIAGVFTMLFFGVLYAWSILKIPFREVFAWSDSALALNFTLTMCTFCLGVLLGSLICRRIGPKITLLIAGALVGGGFCITSCLTETMLPLLYVSYAVLAGFGIGISYNVVVSSVTAWFPDKKGFCSGCLMMGFGLSTLLLGNGISILFDIPAIGWSKTYLLLGIVLAVVHIIAAMLIRRPAPDTSLPAPKAGKKAHRETFEPRDFTTAEMLCSFTFWRSFVCLVFVAAVGNSVISFARDLVLSVGAAPAAAATLVGVLAVCNGIGRIVTGAVFDRLGRRTAMISAGVLTVTASGITLLSVGLHSLPLCILGLCLTGLSYGSCPTVTSAFISAFYGQKHFPVNFGIANFNLIGAALIAAVSNSLYASTGTYTASFVLLLSLAVIALGLNLSIKKP